MSDKPEKKTKAKAKPANAKLPPKTSKSKVKTKSPARRKGGRKATAKVGDAVEYVGLLWDKQEWETMHAYRAFCVYRDLGRGRSLAKAFQANLELTKVNGGSSREVPDKQYCDGVWKHWSTRYRWGERVEAWDLEVDRLAREQVMKEQAEVRVRHIKQYTHLQGVGMVGIMSKSPEEILKTPVDKLAKIVDLGIKGEARVRGMEELVVKVEARELPGLAGLGQAEKEILARALLRAAGEEPEVYGLLSGTSMADEDEEDDDDDDEDDGE